MQYTPSTSDVIAPGSVGVTELGSRVGGFIAGCGQAALLVVLHAVQGIPTDPTSVTQLIQSSVNQHLTVGPKAASGQSSPQTLKTLASQKGVTLTDVDPYQAINQYAGSQDIVIGVSNANALGGPDTGVGGHYITIVGRTAGGDLIVSDPNTPQSQSGQFVTYSVSQLRNAQPFWAGVANVSGPGSGIVGSVGPALGGGGSAISGALSYEPLRNLIDLAGTILNRLGPWLTDPVRLVKLVVGVMLVQSSIGIAVGSGIGGPVLSAMGLPDVGQAVGALGKRRGAGRTISEAATARGKTVIEQRTAQERRRGEERAQRAREAGIAKGVAEQVAAEFKKRSEASKRGHQTRRARQPAPAPAPAPALRRPSRTAQAYFGQFGRASKRGAQQRQQQADIDAENRRQARERMRQRGEEIQGTRSSLLPPGSIVEADPPRRLQPPEEK